ncbi:MAG: hypothetical protein ACXABY_21195 [Candidatus Thorarchaeota archaeon]
MTVEFEWGHDAHKFAEIMRKYRLIVSQYGTKVTITNPFDTER